MDTTLLFKIQSALQVVTFCVMTVFTVSLENQTFAQERNNVRQDRVTLLGRIKLTCETTKQAVVQEIMVPQRTNPQTELLRQISLFRTGIRKSFPQEESQTWETRLLLGDLQQTLRENETDLELIDDIHAILCGDAPEFQRRSFVLLKKALETYRPLLWKQNQKQHIDEVKTFFDSLPGLIESYLESPNAANADAVSEALRFLHESGKTEELTTLIRTSLIQPNLRIRVRSEMIAPLFMRSIHEPVDVNENILGTWVRGSGQMVGKSSASFVSNKDAAAIRVIFKGTLNSTTIGTNGPVRLHSKNTTTILTSKDIILAKKSITTKPASTRAKQSSQISQVEYLRPGPFVQMIAPNQIRERKPASDAESERLTRLRFNKRIDATVNENVEPFTEIFQRIVDGQGGNKAVRLDFRQMYSTDKELLVEAVAGNGYQLSTITEPPVMSAGAGLCLQLHESLADNAGICEWSGKTLVEEQVVAELKKRFPQLLENTEANGTENEPSLAMTFSDRPVKMSFNDDVIKATIETTSIERGGNVYPGMEIEFQFRIEATNEGYRLVVAESPKVLPLGFDPEQDKLSSRETIIRTVIMKKLERITEKPIEWKTSKIEMKVGTMTVKPAYLSAVNGWLLVGLDLVEWMAN